MNFGESSPGDGSSSYFPHAADRNGHDLCFGEPSRLFSLVFDNHLIDDDGHSQMNNIAGLSGPGLSCLLIWYHFEEQHWDIGQRSHAYQSSLDVQDQDQPPLPFYCCNHHHHKLLLQPSSAAQEA